MSSQSTSSNGSSSDGSGSSTSSDAHADISRYRVKYKTCVIKPSKSPKKKEVPRPRMSRCSMHRMNNFLSGLPQGTRIKDLLSTTPFGHLVQGPSVQLDSIAVEYLVSNWDKDRKGFNVNGNFVEFTISDVAVILGLPRRGELIDFDQFSESPFYNEEFKGKTITCLILENKLQMAFEEEDELNKGYLEDRAVVLGLLYICCTFLFSRISYSLDGFLVDIIEDLSKVAQYDWAEAIYHYITDEMTRCIEKEKPSGFSGCAIVLCVWLYEHCTLYNEYREDGFEGIYPRLFRWSKVKMGRRLTYHKRTQQMNVNTIIFDLVPDAHEMVAYHLAPMHGDDVDVLPPHTEEAEHHAEEKEATAPLYRDIVNKMETRIDELLKENETLKAELHKNINVNNPSTHIEELIQETNSLKTRIFELLQENHNLKETVYKSEARIAEQLAENNNLKEAAELQSIEFAARLQSLKAENKGLKDSSDHETRITQLIEKISSLKEAAAMQHDQFNKRIMEIVEENNKLKAQVKVVLEGQVEKDATFSWEEDAGSWGRDDVALGPEIESTSQVQSQSQVQTMSQLKGKRHKKTSWALSSPYTQERKKPKETAPVVVDENAPDSSHEDKYKHRKDYAGRDLLDPTMKQDIETFLS